MNDAATPMRPNTDTWPQFQSHRVIRAAPILFIARGDDDGAAPHLFVMPGIDPFRPDWNDHSATIDDCFLFEPTVSAMAAKALVGDMAMVYEDGEKPYYSVCPRAEFVKGYHLWDTTPKPILMSADNPGGWKLEDLLEALSKELVAKADAMTANDRSLIARSLANHNRRIAKGADALRLKQHEVLGIVNSIRPGEAAPRGL